MIVIQLELSEESMTDKLSKLSQSSNPTKTVNNNIIILCYLNIVLL